VKLFRGIRWILVGLEELGHTQATTNNHERQRIRSAIRDFDVLRTQQQMNRDGLRDVREALEFNSKMMDLLNEKVEKLILSPTITMEEKKGEGDDKN